MAVDVIIPSVALTQEAVTSAPLTPLICKLPLAPTFRLSIPLDPLFGERIMFPVVPPPIVKVLFLRLCMDPSAFSTNPVVPADNVAIGVFPEAIFIKPILADVVDMPPSRRSSAMFVEDNAPLFLCSHPNVPVVPDGITLANVACPVVDTFHVELDPKISFKLLPVAPERLNLALIGPYVSDEKFKKIIS